MLKVLIVDDEPFVRQGLKDIIDWKKYGFSLCGEAENGLNAINMIEMYHPHIVITDIKMPGIDGLELVRKASKELQTSTKFIILSGYEDFKYARTAIQLNVKGYLLKPVEEDELITVLLNMKEEINAEREKEKKHFDSIKALASETIKSLIFGNADADDLVNAKQWLGACDNEELYYVIIDIDDYYQCLKEVDADQGLLDCSDIENIIYEVLGRDNSLNIYLEHIYRYGIVVNKSILQNFNYKIEELVDTLYNKFSETEKVSVSIFVGAGVMNAAELKTSYDSCHEAMNYQHLSSENNVIYYDEVKDLSFSYDLSNIEFFSKLLEAIENNMQDEIILHVDSIFKEMQEKHIDPEIIKAYIIKFELEFIKIVSEMSGDASEILRKNTIANTKDRKMHICKSEFIRFCTESANYYKALKDRKSNGLMYEIEKYIQKNYNTDISLKSLAEVFYINSVYLGQLFKKNFGAYFSDYLNQLRIEEAMRLLRRTDLKVYEVAQSVGYIDTNYFICKFEKYCSMTPSQYKRSCS